MSELAYYIEQGKKLAEASSLTAALENIRQDALAKLALTQIPNRKVETWKYTNITTDLQTEFKVQSPGKPAEFKLDERFQTVVFCNGILDRKQSQLENITLRPLAEVDQAELTQYVTELDQDFKDDFTYKLNTAYLQKGYQILFKKKHHYTRPIKFIYTCSNTKDLTGTLNLIHTPSETQVAICEQYLGQYQSLICPMTLIRCEQNSKLEHIIIQHTGPESLFLNGVHSTLARDAEYNNICLHLGGKKSRSLLSSRLEGENANTQLHGLYLLKNKQHHDTLSKIHHQAPNSYSDQLYKGILAEESKGIFTGKVFVEQEAQLTQAKQLNKNLLLSAKAHGFSRPQLEIYADDVKCAHGSTTGQLSHEELFYFQARGISKEQAQRMLAAAFAYDVVLKIRDKKIREIVHHLIEDKDIFNHA